MIDTEQETCDGESSVEEDNDSAADGEDNGDDGDDVDKVVMGRVKRMTRTRLTTTKIVTGRISTKMAIPLISPKMKQTRVV